MKISIYPLASCLHEQNKIKEEGKVFLDEIFNKLSYSYEIVEKIDKNDENINLIFIQTGGVEGEFLKQIEQFQEPYYLLTYGKNNSLAASMEILSYLKSFDKEGEILHGSMDYIVKRIQKIMMMKQAIIKIKNTKLGVIGKPSDWLIASQVNEEDLFDHYGIRLVHLSIDELCDDFKKISFIPSSNFKYSLQDDLNQANKMSLSIQNICQKYQLKGLTIRCFDLLSKVKTTGCLGLSMLNDQGYIGTCEGDIPTMISMYLMKALLNQPTFQANPSRIDLKNQEMVFAHCTIPLSMCSSYSLDSHFESKIGVAIKGELKKQVVTIFKLSNDLKHYYVNSAEIVENLNEDDLCRTQIKLRFKDSLNYFLSHPYGNHHIIIYGNHCELIHQFMNQLLKK